MPKRQLNQNVHDAAVERIRIVFDNFPKIYVSFSGGKDSSVMLHMVMDEAKRRGRKVGVLFVDLEGQYRLTIEHIQECYDEYVDLIVPFWVCLPIHLRNAVSQYQPHWVCWDPTEKERWIRNPPKMAITDEKHFPFFKRGMEFEEFVPEFGKWYGHENLTACFVGIRTDESLNRYRTIASGKKQTFDPETGFISFPGGCKKFTIRFDPKSKLYYSLTNAGLDRYRGKNKVERTRNVMALTSSPDLKQWTIRSVILEHGDTTKVGFQYSDWQFDGADLIVAIRMAHPDGLGGAHNQHDANYLAFLRIHNFRTLSGGQKRKR